jgi:MFS family permease
MHDASLERSWREDAQPAALVGFAHMSSHFFQMLLPPIYPWLMRDFGISFTQAGFLATVFFVLSSSGQAIAGFAVDRLGAFRMLLVGVALLAASGIALGLAQSYAGLLVTAALAGGGNAMFHPADFTILNRRVSQRRLGHAFAMHGLSGNLGWAAGTTFMWGVTSIWNWHVAAFGAAGIAAAAWLFLLTRRAQLEDSPAHLPAHREHQHTSDRKESLFAFLASPVVWMCFAFFLLATGAGGVLQNFAPSILTHVYGVDLAFGSMALTAYLLGSATGTVIGGFVAGPQRRSELVVATALTVAASVSLCLASGALAIPLLVPGMFVLGCGSGTAGPSRDLLVRRAAMGGFGAGALGRVYGFVYSGLDFGLALAPLLVGRLLDHSHFQAGLVAVAALQMGATLAAFRIGRRL